MPGSVFGIRSPHVLTLCVFALLAIGVLMVQSAMMGVTGNPDARPLFNGLAIKHLGFALVAFATFLVVSRFDYRRLLSSGPLWKSPILWALVGAAVLSVAVLVVGTEVNGARRWIRFGPLQLQPSEVAKWTSAVFLAWWFAKKPVPLDKFWKGFVVTAVPIGVLCLLVVIEDFGTAALIGIVAFAMFVVGGIRWWHLAIVVPPALGAAAFFVMGTPYRWRRMTSFLDPWADPRGDGYHMIQSLMSFASGGVSGRGLGNGIQKLGYLPEDTTDFVFAVVCEELGFFGAMMVVLMYLGILLVAVRAIRSTKLDPFGKLLAFALSTTICTQACINLAVATVSMPTKGMSLPLISAGGTGLILTCASLGLFASVLRVRHQLEHGKEPLAASPISASEPVATY
jgi:cell division protein FtsW